MPCGICPGEQPEFGVAHQNLSLISAAMGAATSPYSNGGRINNGNQGIAAYIQSARNAYATTTYGKEGIRMSTYIPQYRTAKTEVADLYSNVFRPYSISLDLDSSEGGKLESLIDRAAPVNIEARLTPEYKTVREMMGEADNIIDLAQAIDQKRRSISREIESLREKEAA